ncbi:LOW QUALITY PROTEIN: hypothetical protein PHMEG_00035941 [Phytophthora megakarya]|uniref:Uncharacterized protein n=1 Tax=Phytophthora megakarya TaxID=4795 RepID=A0A225UMK1_9STRA|nr:LOW QUALITY PROTEIN: hypothetical protein PHMEG_00035941 [Phytophthora megakarya]
MQSKQLSEKIIDVLSLQPSTTYRLGMKWLASFHSALRTGKLEDFTGHELADTSGFPNLSRVSSVGDITASQLSFADLVQNTQSETEPPVTYAEEESWGTGTQCESTDCVCVAAKEEGFGETG